MTAAAVFLSALLAAPAVAADTDSEAIERRLEDEASGRKPRVAPKRGADSPGHRDPEAHGAPRPGGPGNGSVPGRTGPGGPEVMGPSRDHTSPMGAGH